VLLRCGSLLVAAVNTLALPRQLFKPLERKAEHLVVLDQGHDVRTSPAKECKKCCR